MSDPYAYPPRFMDRREAARYLAVGTTTFDELVSEGVFPRPKKVRSKVVWDRIDLDEAATNILDDGTAKTVTQRMLEQGRKHLQTRKLT
jgi:predicted DNA-binding transcriptional regulator AlpA